MGPHGLEPPASTGLPTSMTSLNYGRGEERDVLQTKSTLSLLLGMETHSSMRRTQGTRSVQRCLVLGAKLFAMRFAATPSKRETSIPAAYWSEKSTTALGLVRGGSGLVEAPERTPAGSYGRQHLLIH